MHSKQNDTVLQLKQHQQQAVKAERRLGNTSTRDQQQRAHTAQHQPIGPSLGRIPPGQSGARLRLGRFRCRETGEPTRPLG